MHRTETRFAEERENQITKANQEYCKSRENSYQVLQVTCAASERAMKSKVRMLLLALLLVLRTRNNTYSNKLVIFSGIALCYGDNYIFITTCVNKEF